MNLNKNYHIQYIFANVIYIIITWYINLFIPVTLSLVNGVMKSHLSRFLIDKELSSKYAFELKKSARGWKIMVDEAKSWKAICLIVSEFLVALGGTFLITRLVNRLVVSQNEIKCVLRFIYSLSF